LLAVCNVVFADVSWVGLSISPSVEAEEEEEARLQTSLLLPYDGYVGILHMAKY
jgi:hypothetical protein